ncbi:phosphatase PAP2 family protein [Nocardioides alkalitolerans]|uniref:phosphatase PAP2 family protein n=1 Tax=Nocardioides alkalitolerans TaxID=281714 RepID=UPI001FDFB94E|nr:phosphatase PAP2 family protein [Nocardioides alkalitolerans]
MYRRAYVLLIGVAATMAVLTFATALALDRSVVDPEGFLGPGWLRFPLLVGAALLVDLVPRALWRARLNPRETSVHIKERWHQHWTRERFTLVALGIGCFYVTYACYRNLKSFLPFVLGDKKYDNELHALDKVLFLGNDPSAVLHTLFGFVWFEQLISTIYLWYLPMVPVLVAIWVIWSRNISFGYWFVTSQVIAWTLGTASYYMLPALGPGFAFPWLYEDISTGASDLLESLFYSRTNVLWGDGEGLQSTAAFASLHTAITLLWALMVQYTIRNRIIHWIFWANFGLTIIATLYFGWHYVADDIAGAMIAIVAFYVGGVASGQKFDRRGLTSHPTTTTSKVPLTEGGRDADVRVEDPSDASPEASRLRFPWSRRKRRGTAGADDGGATGSGTGSGAAGDPA